MCDMTNEDNDLSNTVATGTPGFVGQVCREWLVREDEVVAHRLQDEEFQSHYGNNRSKSKIVRQDTQQARVLQTEEEVVANEVQQQLELMNQMQQEEDEKVAQEVQQLLSQQEVEKKRHLEEADELYARLLQDKEKERMSKKKREKSVIKEQREVQKVLAQHVMQENQEICEEPLENDFSDLCVQPAPGMDECQSKILQEQQDEELARLLQEQESKRGTPSDRDKRLAVETQDREIARYLQEQERAKARKAKEKARLKAQQRLQEGAADDNASAVSSNDDSSNNGSLRSKSNSSREDNQLAQTSANENCQVSNIAMAIDPTYNRRLQEPNHIPTPSNSAPVTPIKVTSKRPTPSDRPSYHTEIRNIRHDDTQNSQELQHDVEEDDDDPVPPYMPIQGQRRTGSLEKHSAKKGKKDGCKNQ